MEYNSFHKLVFKAGEQIVSSRPGERGVESLPVLKPKAELNNLEKSDENLTVWHLCFQFLDRSEIGQASRQMCSV